MTQLLARLKPYAPGKGIKLKTYSIHGYVFRVEKGWYEVDEGAAAYLRTVRNGEDNESPFAFDVGTPAEARAIDFRERKSSEVKADASSPIRSHKITRDAAARAGALTTADLPINQEDNTDALEGDASDLDKADLAPPRPVQAAPPPGAPEDAGVPEEPAAPVLPGAAPPPGAPRSWAPPRSSRPRSPGT